MDLPIHIQMSMGSLLAHGNPILSVEPVGGGMVNTAAKVVTKHCPYFVKWKTNTPHDFFAREAAGLELLREAGALQVPGVIDFDLHSEERQQQGWTNYLVLEWIEERPPSDMRRFRDRFAEGLARLHRESPSPDGRFGLEMDNYLGSQPQSNGWMESWPAFYRDRRVLPQMERAKRLGRLPAHRERLVQAVCDRMEELLASDSPFRGPGGPACLIHGDLWSGNYLTAGDEPVVIDPAVCYGDREVEMAYVELFGGFPPGFVHAYNACYPLDAGYAYRRPLHQLYPLLIHLNHFGETYGPAVDEACRHYL